jgi:hypothetical protein
MVEIAITIFGPASARHDVHALPQNRAQEALPVAVLAAAAASEPATLASGKSCVAMHKA